MVRRVLIQHPTRKERRMAKKKMPKYVLILEGMNCCYGGTEDRDCGSCPYDKYNDTGYYGDSSGDCMLKLNADAKKWAESMEMFTLCRDCVCWHKDRDEHDLWRFADEKTKDGYCSVWRTMMTEMEFCSRGGI